MQTFHTEPWHVGAAKRSKRHAAQTRKRARRRKRERERARLLALGADPAWVERVLGDAAA